MAERQYVSFGMDDRLYGIDILNVREIIRNVHYTPVEKAPAAVRGLLNLRGQVITILDPSSVLGLPPREVGRETRCIILKTTAELDGTGGDELPEDAVGLLVDRISDVADACGDGLDPAPANAKDVGEGLIEGVLKLEGRLLLVLSLKKLLATGNGAAANQVVQA